MAPVEAHSGREPQSMEQVEAAFVAALDALDRILVIREQLAASLRQGSFNLSRARYSLGALRVGPLQYPASMMASVRLAVEANPGQIGQPPTIKMEEQLSDLPQETAGFTAGLPVEEKSVGLRRRGPTGAPASSSLNQTGLIEEPSSSGQKPQPADPLRWFGALPPPALRDAQRDFSTVLSTAVELADAVTRLECSRKAYFLLAGLDEDLPHDLPRLVDDLEISRNEGDGCIRRKDAGSRRDAVESKPFTRKEELGGLVGRGEESMLMKELALKYGATV